MKKNFLVAMIFCVILRVGVLTNSAKENESEFVTWKFSPSLSATFYHAFHFDFELDDYSYIEAYCDNGTLKNFYAQGQPSGKEMRFEQGEPLGWVPDENIFLVPTKSAKVTFTVFDGEEVVSKGVLDIVRTGIKDGESSYKAQLIDNSIFALGQKKGELTASVVMD